MKEEPYHPDSVPSSRSTLLPSTTKGKLSGSEGLACSMMRSVNSELQHPCLRGTDDTLAVLQQSHLHNQWQTVKSPHSLDIMQVAFVVMPGCMAVESR